MTALFRLTAGLLLLGWPGLVTAQPDTLHRYTFRRGLMGTEFILTLYAPDNSTAQRVSTAVNARMDSLNLSMSDYLDGSEINRLTAKSGTGQWVRVSRALFSVLQKARWVAKTSGGRYDPTIGPLSQLWRRAVRRGEFPTARQRRKARQVVGYRKMQLDSATQSVKLRRSNMRLDVGGIGQGFAIDEAASVLRNAGLPAFLLDLGGDVLAGDAPPNQPGWRVALDSTTVLLKNAAITTSGDTYRHLDYRGKRYSHIMNPRSGLGLRHFVRATVLAPDGWRADALTKVFSVARGWPSRLRQSRRLLRRFPGVSVLLIEKKSGQLRRWQSPGFPVPE